MRMAGAVALLVIVLEVLLALGFLAGYVWVGGLRGGLMTGGVVLLLIVIPWLGELRVWFDSRGPAATVRLSWWGRVSFRTLADATELRIRFLMIPWRRRVERKPKETPPAEAPPPELCPTTTPPEGTPRRRAASKPKRDILTALHGLDADSLEGWSRMVGAGLQALNELTWGAEEIALRVDDPSQQRAIDRALAQILARRELGALDVMVAAGEGPRRVRIRYRVGMLRMALATLQLAVDGRALALARTMKEKKRAGESAESQDQKLIAEIAEAREDGPHV